MTDKSTFGDYMRGLRERQKMSLREVAAKTGVSVSLITQIENGRRNAPGPDVLKRLAPAYDVSVKDLAKAAGYLDEPVKPSVSEEEEMDRAYRFAVSDPRFKFGTRITGPVTIDVKRFIIEIYEQATGKKLLEGD